MLFGVLVVLGYVTGKLVHSEPLISGSGIPQVEGQILGRISPRALPVLIKKFVGGR